MSLDERMEYYRKQYAPQAAKKKPQPKKAQKSSLQKPQREAVKKPQTTPAEGREAEVKSARKGLFSRIKARFFGE